METQTHLSPNSRYLTIFQHLVALIQADQLPAGLVLLEAPLAKLFSTSRVPVRHALHLLHEQKLISRFDGRGFLVNPLQKNNLSPKRLPITKKLLQIQEDDVIDNRLLSCRIYDELYQEISNIILFGHYKIDEQCVADFFKVSRSVVREALKNLQIQGMVEKEPYGDWLAGPLTAKQVIENYELRFVLEPFALKKNIAHISSEQLKIIQKRIYDAQHTSNLSANIIQHIEKDLHSTICDLSNHNQKMSNILHQAQSSIHIGQLLHNIMYIKDYSHMLSEHAKIIDALLYGSMNCAINALEQHLLSAQKRSIDYLKVFSIIPDNNIPPYLERLS